MRASTTYGAGRRSRGQTQTAARGIPINPRIANGTAIARRGERLEPDERGADDGRCDDGRADRELELVDRAGVGPPEDAADAEAGEHEDRDAQRPQDDDRHLARRR